MKILSDYLFPVFQAGCRIFSKLLQSRVWLTLLVMGSILFPTEAMTQSATPWQSIFNGETLDGWTQKGGDARYYVEDEMIVGEAVLNSPNSFLCTERDFDDFILEFEVKVDKGLNSGVQLRSKSIKAYRNYRVHGYQVEIDPDDPHQSGGIYDEARRGWLYDRARQEKMQAVDFQPGAWNSYRIEAIGDSIRTWVNGVPAAHIVDNMTPDGFIGLQVHGVGNNHDKEGLKVRWRDLRIMTGSDAVSNARSISIKPKKYLYNRLSKQEVEEGWKVLFDGQSAGAWRSVNGEKFPSQKWLMHNVSLTFLGQGGGSIVTRDRFSDFELTLDFKLSRGANSGIKYYVVENEGTAYGLEYQLLDDKRHPDAERGRNGNRRLAALYDIMPAENTQPRPVGEWNTARIVSRDNHIEHWLNGKKVLEFKRGSARFRKMVERSKYSHERFDVYGSRFGEADEGRILLQDHGDRVSFRNIKIRTWN
jgi:hypothetical protein